ncbi:hypothetical protein HN51_036845 [Arachis hypogaea]|uniref:Knottins-like domain-containing protein n=2 Tax=Arachis TaxID=3817 RepID=A0A445DT38_ARAHY|nr:defensin Ec-AMP-D2 [Arachis duranensis]XP_016193516.1 defensin Ec-AMP-D2 [Arachis ipaensis]XP_025637607.1 defensin Ec-AMP-D2 [Arachis hypogaea]XP_025689503.1 defensin Ec-AMP-D2 [Arachis hypogaea]XP_057751009.1 defensin Ec-AMP-D2-like [Arachis stenosperma]RYR66307.1 hypothetical protein Ahy_A03g012296 [Arachis hypogaea]
MERARFGLILCLVLLIASQEMVVQSEGRKCDSQSHHFKGKCFSDTNCASVCHGEGFTGGECRGFRQRCFCTRNC